MQTTLVTTLKRQATTIIDELREDKEPVLITQHGAPAAYLVDVEDFEPQPPHVGIGGNRDWGIRHQIRTS